VSAALLGPIPHKSHLAIRPFSLYLSGRYDAAALFNHRMRRGERWRKRCDRGSRNGDRASARRWTLIAQGLATFLPRSTEDPMAKYHSAHVSFLLRGQRRFRMAPRRLLRHALWLSMKIHSFPQLLPVPFLRSKYKALGFGRIRRSEFNSAVPAFCRIHRRAASLLFSFF